ncbi:MAG: hypothetical protein LQ343_006160 [Gyalolechia ehrenbergii]|nr:MAG: hypothetical protein LQ343_006160 [Gyalolechia ehrenbergii]
MVSPPQASNAPDSRMRSPHALLVHHLYTSLQNTIRTGNVEIDGDSLDIPTVVAVSCHGIAPTISKSPAFINRIADSVALVFRLIGEGKTIYGVNTGFGGSADTRSNQNEALQAALLQHHHFGVLTATDRGLPSTAPRSIQSAAMPQDWVKGTMLVRSNTIARGHSAVSFHAIETVIALLRHNLTPIIPLRGSISASGDLSPLSYVAGMITGNPDVYVQTPTSGIISAKEALDRLGIAPIILGPKEGLGFMNGTATSAAVASLAIYETHHIALLSQFLTAMASEALLASADNFDPFISDIRPHRGQVEAARNIRHFLHGSRLVRGLTNERDTRQASGLLYQDRYALRTSPQWIGPQLEDLQLAHEQITVELNSTTDNPLFDVSKQKTHHGGNFQAASITSAMEKARSGLQMVGKMLFAQSSELINPMLNNGLPPNLAADEPSLSFTMKGVDIGMASYMSELAFLANPVSSHVHLLDLSFFQSLEPLLYAVNHQAFGPLLSDLDFDELHSSIWDHVQVTWLVTANKDCEERYMHVVDSTIGVIVKLLLATIPQARDSGVSSPAALAAITEWKTSARKTIAETFATVRTRFFEKPDTAAFLGLGSRTIYTYVREKLKVPLHRGLKDHPEPHDMFASDGSRKRTIGSNIAIIYEALRSGAMHEPLMECLLEEESSGHTISTSNFNGWKAFGNGVASTIPGTIKDQGIRNGHTGPDATFSNGEPEPIIVEAKRRHSVSLGEINGKRRRSLAALQGSLTGL